MVLNILTLFFFLGMDPYMLPAQIKILESVKSSLLKWLHSLIWKATLPSVDFVSPWLVYQSGDSEVSLMIHRELW